MLWTINVKLFYIIFEDLIPVLVKEYKLKLELELTLLTKEGKSGTAWRIFTYEAKINLYYLVISMYYFLNLIGKWRMFTATSR